MRIVFLDFDGVLNTPGWCQATEARAHRQQQWQTQVNHTLLEKHTENLACLDPEKVAFLNEIVVRADANIVLSTSWSWFNSVPLLTALLGAVGLNGPDRVIGALATTVESLAESRHESILTWLRRVPVQSYVALDDGFLPGVVQVHTNTYEGLLAEHVSLALKHLGVS
jgi:hypothetical protein